LCKFRELFIYQKNNYMKRFLLVAMLSAGYAAVAQEPLLLKKSFVPDGQQKLFNADTTGERLLSPLLLQRGLLPQATFSHQTSRGKVYNLPIDNMPCLVPDMQQVRPMPGQHYFPEGRMPNVFPRQRIIPEERENKKK
jgi:hypothetical protein